MFSIRILIPGSNSNTIKGISYLAPTSVSNNELQTNECIMPVYELVC